MNGAFFHKLASEQNWPSLGMLQLAPFSLKIEVNSFHHSIPLIELLFTIFFLPPNSAINTIFILPSFKQDTIPFNGSLATTYAVILQTFSMYVSTFKPTLYCWRRYSFNLSNALKRCEMEFFTLLSISAYVSLKPSGSKIESQPKFVGPLLSTIWPRVIP